MPFVPATQPHLPPPAPAVGTAASIAVLLECLLLHLLAALAGQLPRSWHRHAMAARPSPYTLELMATSPLSDIDRPRAVLRPELATDGTHLACEHPMLWAIGPGPNRGARRLARATPTLPPESARAPP